MKKCFKCHKEKSRSAFYKHNQMSDGLLGKCKDCARLDALKHRNDNLEKIREYDRTRWKQPNRLKALKAYAKSEAGIRARNKGSKTWATKNKHKRSAHSKVWNMIIKGLIKQNACEVCGKKKAHAHHDDYTKPLDIIWLCHTHHMERHRLCGDFRRT